jgi:undecaprenyl-diphosphatase
MSALAVVGALLLLMCGQTKLAAFWLGVAITGAAINQAGKSLIDRPRPGATLRDESVRERNASFPSGHAMGAAIGYGTLLYVGMLLLRRRLAKITLALAIVVFVMVVGWSRIYLRAHWTTDVIAGFAIGIGWLLLAISLVGRFEGRRDTSRQ